MEQPPSCHNKIVVGIDFGTTFSGIAWAKVGDDQPNIIQQWPGDSAPSSEKVPTQILYDNTDVGTKWGYQIPSLAERYQWFKLALETTAPVRPSGISKRYSDVNAVSSDRTHTAQQLATDYLRALKSHLVFTLGRELGHLQAHNTPLEFFITVPAVWSDLAKEKTLVAAQQAGLGNYSPIHMISEPEAAAMYVLQRKKLHNLSVGDTFVVCDAGGGTVDLISYTVTKLDPVIEVKEAAPGTGGLCGSTFLNGRFKEYLEFKLGHEPGWDNEVLQDAINDFELQVKRNYSTAANNEVYTVSVPGLGQNATLGINKRGKLLLRSEVVKEILKPVIAEVVKLVLEQIKATNMGVKSILLVGGFGSSQYLQERIRGAVKHTIEVIKPPYAWSAVVQGAVIKGLTHHDPRQATVRLSSRAARMHIGINVTVPFDQHIHQVSKRYWNGYDGDWRILQMNWFIKKGDAVKEETPFQFKYFLNWLVAEGRKDEIQIDLHCDRTGRAPATYLDKKVKELVRLTADISSIPESCALQKMGNDNKMYYYFEFSIEVTYLSAYTRYDIVHNGTRYGTVTAEYV